MDGVKKRKGVAVDSRSTEDRKRSGVKERVRRRTGQRKWERLYELRCG